MPVGQTCRHTLLLSVMHARMREAFRCAVYNAQVWDMGNRPSLRFVRDTLRMRRSGQIQLVLRNHLNASDPAWAALPGPGGDVSGAGQPGVGPLEVPVSVVGSSSSSSSSSSPTAQQLTRQQAVEEEEEGSLNKSPLDSMLSGSDDEGSGGMTVGECMPAKWLSTESLHNPQLKGQCYATRCDLHIAIVMVWCGVRWRSGGAADVVPCIP
jgi:hypothetical protein